jgi:hypothetical protein
LKFILVTERKFSLSALGKFWRVHISDICYIKTKEILTHRQTFLFWPNSFEWHYLFCTWRFIPPTHKTIASAAPKLYSRITYLKKPYCHRISQRFIANTIIGPMQSSIL